jgi:Uncharacterized protein conserved in bacteria (DUF2130)
VFLYALHERHGWTVAAISAAITTHFLFSAALVIFLADAHRRFGVAAVTRAAAVFSGLGVLYNYLSGSEFKQRVEAIVESFVEMQEDLQEERRVAERRWSKREKQIQRVITNTSGMYGDLQGLIGSSLRAIPALEHVQNDDG